MAILTCREQNFIIRPFRPGDAPAARRLIETVWREHFHDHPDPFVRDFMYSRLSDLENTETLYVDRALFLCAIAENEIIGTGAIKRCDDRECEMVRMFVGPAYRGRGIARAISDRLISFARRAGYERIRLSSNNALTASHRLYERMGFQPTGPWDPGGEGYSRYYVLRI
ncbi:GNAT family N-acetyltransferase [Bradyrhizobium tropiciagri]|uniref:GNAT family N-acetyltransferase n=1 Tax=Bradyrhizobium tropiciagri TaxID=312253 RepID=UPI000B178DC1